MSYCRWSSDDFQCDVYVYESAEGWQTHVARNRRVYKEPLPEPIDLVQGNEKEWFDRYQKVQAMGEVADSVPIGLSRDGESYSDRTPGDCANRLESLKAEGYIVPQYAIDELRAEANQ